MKGVKRVKSWLPTADTGPKGGIAVSLKVMARVISEAENPLIVMGGECNVLDGKLMDCASRLSKKKNIPIVATADSKKWFNEKGIEAEQIGLVEVVNMLLDPEWSLNDSPFDLVIFGGIEYAMNNQMFNSLKNFSGTKSASISRYYQPNASVSFPNLTDEIWEEYLDKLCELVR